MKCANPKCNNEVNPQIIKRGYPKKHCSHKCAKQHRNYDLNFNKFKEITSTLVKCGHPKCSNTFYQDIKRHRKYCSSKCCQNVLYHQNKTTIEHRLRQDAQNQYSKLKRDKLRSIKKCALPGCSNTFTSKYKRKYCSDECLNKAMKIYRATNTRVLLSREMYKISALISKEELEDSYIIKLMNHAGIKNPSENHIKLYREKIKLERKIYEKQRNTTNILRAS